MLPHLLLVATAAGAVRLTADVVASFAAMPSGRIVAAPYAVAAALLLMAAWALAVDPPRGRLLAIGAAILLASWAAAIGYGPTEFAARATAALGVVAALVTLRGVTRGWAVVALIVLVAALAPLAYVATAHPPLALIVCYAVAGVGISAAALALLPRATRRWPLPRLGLVAVVAWLVGAILLLLAYGPPMTSS
jgi:hypothetical protein